MSDKRDKIRQGRERAEAILPSVSAPKEYAAVLINAVHDMHESIIDLTAAIEQLADALKGGG